MSGQSELEALSRVVEDVGYLHKHFSVEVKTAAELEQPRAAGKASKAKVIVVRNEITQAEQRYRRGRGKAWLERFKRDLTAGAFN